MRTDIIAFRLSPAAVRRRMNWNGARGRLKVTSLLLASGGTTVAAQESAGRNALDNASFGVQLIMVAAQTAGWLIPVGILAWLLRRAFGNTHVAMLATLAAGWLFCPAPQYSDWRTKAASIAATVIWYGLFLHADRRKPKASSTDAPRNSPPADPMTVVAPGALPPPQIHPDDLDLVKDEDYAFWRATDFEMLKMLDDQTRAFRLANFAALKDQGWSSEAASERVRWSFPAYYMNPSTREDEWHKGEDAHLPMLIRDRISRATMSLSPEERRASDARTMNAFWRRMIRSGRV